jgi:hypothetical protein
MTPCSHAGNGAALDRPMTLQELLDAGERQLLAQARMEMEMQAEARQRRTDAWLLFLRQAVAALPDLAVLLPVEIPEDFQEDETLFLLRLDPFRTCGNATIDVQFERPGIESPWMLSTIWQGDHDTGCPFGVFPEWRPEQLAGGTWQPAAAGVRHVASLPVAVALCRRGAEAWHNVRSQCEARNAEQRYAPAATPRIRLESQLLEVLRSWVLDLVQC